MLTSQIETKSRMISSIGFGFPDCQRFRANNREDSREVPQTTYVDLRQKGRRLWDCKLIVTASFNSKEEAMKTLKRDHTPASN